MPLRFTAEIMREKLFLNLHQELPYQLTVETESWDDRDDGSVEVHLSVYVAREEHSGIILGKGGQTMRRIGTSAHEDLELALNQRVHLFSHVKYRKVGWTTRPVITPGTLITMPDWQAEGIVLSVRPHGGEQCHSSVLTADHGRHAGLVRGGSSSKIGDFTGNRGG